MKINIEGDFMTKLILTGVMVTLDRKQQQTF